MKRRAMIAILLSVVVFAAARSASASDLSLTVIDRDTLQELKGAVRDIAADCATETGAPGRCTEALDADFDDLVGTHVNTDAFTKCLGEVRAAGLGVIALDVCVSRDKSYAADPLFGALQGERQREGKAPFHPALQRPDEAGNLVIDRLTLSDLSSDEAVASDCAKAKISTLRCSEIHGFALRNLVGAKASASVFSTCVDAVRGENRSLIALDYCLTKYDAIYQMEPRVTALSWAN